MLGVCAWCHAEITGSSIDGLDDGRITHGICLACVTREFADVGIPLTNFLDALPAPVAVVNAEGIILMVNNAAAQLIDRPKEAVSGLLGGDVFGCVYAGLPGGCGNTVHCSACTIRNTVMESMRTGMLIKNQPAYLKAGAVENPTDYDMLITTEKTNGIVLLRIDEIKSAA